MSLVPFQFETHEVRAIDRSGDPWFVLADVCRVLQIQNSRRVAADMLDEDEKGVCNADTPGGPQEMVVINESGLYSLTLRSRKPEAKRFKKWITAEVLPALRKTGRYIAQEAPFPPPALSEAALDKLRAELRGDMAKVVTASLEVVLPAMVRQSIDSAAFSLVRDHVSVGELLDTQNIPSKGRRGLVTLCSRALGTWCRARGVAPRERAIGQRSLTYLYPVAEARAWMAAEGREIIQRWLSSRGGQGTLPLPRPARRAAQ